MPINWPGRASHQGFTFARPKKEETRNSAAKMCAVHVRGMHQAHGATRERDACSSKMCFCATCLHLLSFAHASLVLGWVPIPSRACTEDRDRACNGKRAHAMGGIVIGVDLLLLLITQTPARHSISVILIMKGRKVQVHPVRASRPATRRFRIRAQYLH